MASQEKFEQCRSYRRALCQIGNTVLGLGKNEMDEKAMSR